MATVTGAVGSVILTKEVAPDKQMMAYSSPVSGSVHPQMSLACGLEEERAGRKLTKEKLNLSTTHATAHPDMRRIYKHNIGQSINLNHLNTLRYKRVFLFTSS